MAGAHICCRYACPFSVIPCRGHFPENGIEPVGNNGSDVLQHDVARSHQANDSHEFVEQAATGAFLDAGLLAGGADVLAGKSPTHNVS